MRQTFHPALAAFGATVFGVGAFALASGVFAAPDQMTVKLMLASGSSLYDAVRAAEGAARGQAFDAFPVVEAGKLLFNIKVKAGDQLVTVHYDPKAAQIVASESGGPIAGMIDSDGDEPVDFGKLKTPLAGAIGAAEAKVKGRAVDAEYVNEKGSATIDVSVTHDDGVLHRVSIDAESGAILKAEASNAPAVDANSASLNGNSGSDGSLLVVADMVTGDEQASIDERAEDSDKSMKERSERGEGSEDDEQGESESGDNGS